MRTFAKGPDFGNWLCSEAMPAVQRCPASLPRLCDPISFPVAAPMGHRSAVSEPGHPQLWGLPWAGPRLHSRCLGGSAYLSPPNPKPTRECLLPAREGRLFPSFLTLLGERRGGRGRAGPSRRRPRRKLGGTSREPEALAKERVGSLPWLQGPGEESRGCNGRAKEGRGEATGRPGQGWKQDGRGS